MMLDGRSDGESIACGKRIVLIHEWLFHVSIYLTTEAVFYFAKFLLYNFLKEKIHIFLLSNL